LYRRPRPDGARWRFLQAVSLGRTMTYFIASPRRRPVVVAQDARPWNGSSLTDVERWAVHGCVAVLLALKRLLQTEMQTLKRLL
jgi:hypothetical protein